LVYIISKTRIRKVYNCNGYASHGIVFAPSHQSLEWKKYLKKTTHIWKNYLLTFEGKHLLLSNKSNTSITPRYFPPSTVACNGGHGRVGVKLSSVTIQKPAFDNSNFRAIIVFFFCSNYSLDAQVKCNNAKIARNRFTLAKFHLSRF
jgi:hypothetical protein